MIVDMTAWAGFWGTTPLSFNIEQVRSALRGIGVSRIHLSAMHAVWCHNPHSCNDMVYSAAEAYQDVDPVPVLDPTIPSWPGELEKAMNAPRARWVKMIPAYSGYTLRYAGEAFDAITRVGMGVMIQVRMEDPRRQHPLAQVPDTAVREIVDASECFPDLNMMIAGGTLSALLEAGPVLRKCPNLYADISQVDGIWGVKPLLDAGLKDRLLFGSHAPFFIPGASLTRVIYDLDEITIKAILKENAERLWKNNHHRRV